MYRVTLWGFALLLAACQPDMTAAPDTPTSCIASELQHLIDKPIEVLEEIALPEPTRIIGPDTAVTMDYREDRLNIAYARTRMITRVYCG